MKKNDLLLVYLALLCVGVIVFALMYEFYEIYEIYEIYARYFCNIISYNTFYTNLKGLS